MSSRHLALDNARLHAEMASLRGQLARVRADNGHLRAKLAIVNERLWAGDQRGIHALRNSESHLHDITGFCPGGAL